MTTGQETFIVQGRVHTFLVPLVAALGASDKDFLLRIDTLAFASSSLFLSVAWLLSKGKSNMTIAFSKALRVGSTTACVVQISRRPLQDLFGTTATRTILAYLYNLLDTPSVELEVRELRSRIGERSLR